MKSCVAPFILAALLAASFILAQEQRPKDEAKPATVQVAALTIQRALPQAAPKGDGMNDQAIVSATVGNSLMSMSVPGVRVSVIVSQPGKHFIGIDKAESKLESFTDDQKTNLRTQDGPQVQFGWNPDGQNQWIEQIPRPFEDRSTVALEIRAPRIPAAAAREIQLKGKLVLKSGAVTKTVEKKNLAEGSEIALGLCTIKVAKVEGNDLGGCNVTLETSQGFELLQKIEFFDADGLPLDATHIGNSMRIAENQSTIGRQYALSEWMDQVTVKITYFDSIETIEVPLDLKVSVGL
jgi:hypothetical protein